MPTATTPFTEPEWKMPGYTGFIQGLSETYGRTPVLAQIITKDPPLDSFLYTRKSAAPVTTPSRDPCNFPALYKPSAEPANLWPNLQDKGKQDSAKPPTSHLALGDGRVNPFVSSYKTDFKPPFAAGARIRSPLRNKNLSQVVELKELYRSAFQRVGDNRLNHMMEHMKERLAGKVGNASDNAFKLRKLFKMYDTAGTGYIEIEDFRVMTESFGMQLDDDSLLALFSRYDPEATGVIEYPGLMRQLLDSDYYSLYAGATDNTQSSQQAAEAELLASDLRRRFVLTRGRIEKVLASFDRDGSGVLDEKSLLAATSAVNVLLSDKERDYVVAACDRTLSGRIAIADFLAEFLMSSCG